MATTGRKVTLNDVDGPVYPITAAECVVGSDGTDVETQLNQLYRDLTEERAVVTGYGLTCTAIKRAGWVRLSVSGTSQEIKSGTQYVMIASLPDGFRPSAQYFQYAIFFNNSAGCVGQFIVYPSGLMAIGYTSKHPGAETYADIPAGQAVRVEATFPVEVSP